MTKSIWRMAHLALALSTSLFLLIIASTGFILAGASMIEKEPYSNAEEFKNKSLAEIIPVITTHFLEINEVVVSPKFWITVKGLDLNGEQIEAFVHPKTGKIVSVPEKKTQFIQDVTTLHRSLFLHETGRFIIGLNALLLLLIILSGIALILKRQKGFLRFFTRIKKDDWATYYHVGVSRFFLFPILIITITATFLSLIRFNAFGENKKQITKINFPITQSTLEINAFQSFKKIKLSEVQKIEFPFTDDIEECYTIKLHDRELKINQFDGSLLAEVKYPITLFLESISLDLHTGRTSVLWAGVLGVSSITILFFIFSGFVITLKRRKVKIHNQFKASNCVTLILVGSEHGTTFDFALAVHQQFLNHGEKSFITIMNRFQHFPQVRKMLVFTSTYGLGDAPSNANQFEILLQKFPFSKQVETAVIGFGSKQYPDFCGFAIKVQSLLAQQSWNKTELPLHTINNKSVAHFLQWIGLWNNVSALSLSTSMSLYDSGSKNQVDFKVIDKKCDVQEQQTTFILRLEPLKKVSFHSGDLLAIFPQNKGIERLYSIGKIDRTIQLVVKLHPKGLGSTFLYQLEIGTVFKANVLKNSLFHLPKKPVIGIAIGTGIAPFLGMIHEKSAQFEGLYVGFRNRTELVTLFENQANKAITHNKLKKMRFAFSREKQCNYITDFIQQDRDEIISFLKNGGVIMVCGSLDMLQNIESVFVTLCSKPIWDSYKSNHQFLTDCY